MQHLMNATNNSPSQRRMELRKYPNRRYYDTRQSNYVTLEEIHAAIRDGFEVRVTDSKTGEDLTAKVLTQIILDHDAPKLGIFPIELLHQLIRANEPLVRDFVDKYFCGALAAFLQSQRQFEQYLRNVLGLPAAMPAAEYWTRWMMGPFASPFFGAMGGEISPDGGTTPPENANQQDLQNQCAELRRKLELLEAELRQRP
jgi:polyhydroxyalkanoate synthesis repressor PhaR